MESTPKNEQERQITPIFEEGHTNIYQEAERAIWGNMKAYTGRIVDLVIQIPGGWVKIYPGTGRPKGRDIFLHERTIKKLKG